jgi:hypothetical protein
MFPPCPLTPLGTLKYKHILKNICMTVCSAGTASFLGHTALIAFIGVPGQENVNKWYTMQFALTLSQVVSGVSRAYFSNYSNTPSPHPTPQHKIMKMKTRADLLWVL